MATELVSSTMAGELEEMTTVFPYRDWQKAEGLTRTEGYYIEDMATLDVQPWARYGAMGTFVNLNGAGGVNDLQILEIPAGGQTNPVNHLYENQIYVISGSGSASVWLEDGQKQTFEWGTGSLFAIPLNATYQFFNGSGLRPARLCMVTTAPTVLNLFHSVDFVFNNPYRFTDRFVGEQGFFNGEGKMYKGGRTHVWETNFVPDVRSIELHGWKERGANGRSVMFEIAGNASSPHISEFPVGTYKKGHRHGPGAHVIILYGTGFSTLWFDDAKNPIRCKWKTNSVVVPDSNQFHQHFNTGAEPASYLALKFQGRKYQPNEAFSGNNADVSVKEGGNQIEYQDEEPEIHRVFESELAANGAKCKMKGQVPWCTSDEGPGVLGARGRSA